LSCGGKFDGQSCGHHWRQPGIGRASAIAAAARGFRVVVGYASNVAAANEVVSTIEAKKARPSP